MLLLFLKWPQCARFHTRWFQTLVHPRCDPLLILLKSKSDCKSDHLIMHAGVALAGKRANLLNRYSALCWRPVTHARTWAIAHCTDSEDSGKRQTNDGSLVSTAIQIIILHAWVPQLRYLTWHFGKASESGPCATCLRQIFRIGTVRYVEGLWRMRRHGPVIAHCTDSEDFPCLISGKSRVSSVDWT